MSSLFSIAQTTYLNCISTNRIEFINNNDIDKYLEYNIDKWKWYPNYQITNFIKNNFSNDIKIAALSSGNSYYLDKKFYGVRKSRRPTFFEKDIDMQGSDNPARNVPMVSSTHLDQLHL